MKKMLKILLATMLCAAVLVTFACAAMTDFVDAPEESSWKYEGLANAVENGIMKGSNGKLNPDAPLTRAELSAMMVRVLGAQYDKADIDHFIDVAIDAWYVDYIKSGVAIKIINGSGNKMMPNDPVTREQAFAILARTFVLVADDHSAVEDFADAHHVSDWAKSSTAALIEHNVVLGGSANDIRPKSNVTRAEYAAMLDRLVGEYAKPGVSYAGKTIKGSIVITSADVDLTGAIIEGKVIIADALREGEVKLDGVKVEGDLVMRSGTAVVSGEATIKNVIYGNPIHPAEVRAENDVKVEKVLVTENAKEVKNEVSADKVEIQASDAKVELGGKSEYKDVEIKADNATVEVKEDVKVENATVGGSNSTVTGSGKVENATVTENSKVETSGTTVTVKPSEDVTPDAPKEDVKDEDKNKDDGKKDPNETPNITEIQTTKGVVIEEEASYIEYGDGEKIPADVNGKTVTFDFTAYDAETVLKNLYIKANITANCTHALTNFSTNTVESIAEIIAKVPKSTNNKLVEITDEKLEGDMSLDLLFNIVEFAYSLYEEKDVEDAYLFRDLFTEKGIKIEKIGDTIKSTFTGKIGSESFDFVIITAIPKV